MTVLVIQNFEKTGLGLIGRALTEAGHAAEIVGAHEGQALPTGDGSYKALVVLGGGQNALDDAGSPWLPQVLDLMRGFTQAEKPVLGVCLGSQLLARAFGGTNYIGTASEFGWHEIAVTDDGRADPVFSALPVRFRSFQWHDDTFTLPPAQ